MPGCLQSFGKQSPIEHNAVWGVEACDCFRQGFGEGNWLQLWVTELVEGGARMSECRAAGIAALNLTLDGIYEEAEVKAAEDFSEAEEDSTST